MKCPICKKEFGAAGFSQHAKHKHPGKLQRKELVRPNTNGYPWQNKSVWVLVRDEK